MNDDSSFVAKEPCPACGSRDNLARYSDGHGYCFGCQHYEHADGTSSTEAKRMSKGLIPTGEAKALRKRGITEETCKKWGYTVGEFNGSTVQIANYRDETGTLVAQKVRWPNKDFRFLGETDKAGLYGQHLWRNGGKMIVVTEGEIDALSVSQAQGNKWPVVSVKNGAQGAKKCIKASLDYLEKFERVILMFDNDEPGRKAAESCVELFAPGKCFVASLPLKDANEMLVAGRGKEIVDAIWNAKQHRPDGIVGGDDTFDLMMQEDEGDSYPFPWSKLNDKTKGMRTGEVIVLTSGTGMGKSTGLREIVYDILKRGGPTDIVGGLFLEEPLKRTVRDIVGLELNRRLRFGLDGVSREELAAAHKATVGNGRCFFYDHFGSTGEDNLTDRVRYMAKGLGCKWIVIDHLNIAISGVDDDGDERKMIDRMMTKLSTLANEAGCCIIVIVHLKRVDGKGAENGGEISLSHLRGSQGIAQLGHTIIAFERNQQGDKPNIAQVRVLKCRWTGDTGLAGFVKYDADTGRLLETEDNPFSDESGPHDGGAAGDEPF